MQVKISDSIKYIGVDDKTIDLFESQYLVPNGISYNSYPPPPKKNKIKKKNSRHPVH